MLRHPQLPTIRAIPCYPVSPRTILVPEKCHKNLTIPRYTKVSQFLCPPIFAFNVGVSALERSTLLQVINRGNFDQVPAQFLRWTKANGKELAGLKRRRQAEANLWRNA
ncbi:MAG: lysozyme [Desulfobulbus sp.]|nr:lysozyme [Desulfobulbus sp.]